MARVGGLAEQAAAECDGPQHGFERVGRQFLRHQADQRARGAPVAQDVVAVHAHAAAVDDLPRGVAKKNALGIDECPRPHRWWRGIGAGLLSLLI